MVGTLVNTAYISPIGAFGADNAIHSLVVNPAGAIQNQHTRKLSPLTEDSKPPRNEKEEEDLEKTGDWRVGNKSEKPRRVFAYL